MRWRCSRTSATLDGPARRALHAVAEVSALDRDRKTRDRRRCRARSLSPSTSDAAADGDCRAPGIHVINQIYALIECGPLARRLRARAWPCINRLPPERATGRRDVADAPSRSRCAPVRRSGRPRAGGSAKRSPAATNTTCSGRAGWRSHCSRPRTPGSATPTPPPPPSRISIGYPNSRTARRNRKSDGRGRSSPRAMRPGRACVLRDAADDRRATPVPDIGSRGYLHDIVAPGRSRRSRRPTRSSWPPTAKARSLPAYAAHARRRGRGTSRAAGRRPPTDSKRLARRCLPPKPRPRPAHAFQRQGDRRAASAASARADRLAQIV